MLPFSPPRPIACCASWSPPFASCPSVSSSEAAGLVLPHCYTQTWQITVAAGREVCRPRFRGRAGAALASRKTPISLK